MALYMLSTDIAICLIRGTSRTLDAHIASANPDELCISAVTRGELLLGVARQEPLASADEPPTQLAQHAGESPDKAGGTFQRMPKGRRGLDYPMDPDIMKSLRKTTHTVMATLTPNEAKALRARFGITDHTLEQVSQQFKAARKRIRSSESIESGQTAAALPKVVDQFLTRVVCLPWDSTAATHFAAIAVKLHGAGTPMGTTDTMIAGHAIALNAILVTDHENRFSHVHGLKTENWTRHRISQ